MLLEWVCLQYGNTTIQRVYVLVQSQHDPVGFTEDIEKTGRCSLLNLLGDTLLALWRDVRRLDIDRNAGLGSCVGGHDVCDVVDRKRVVIVVGRMKQQQMVIVRLGEARVHVFWFPKERLRCCDVLCCVITGGPLTSASSAVGEFQGPPWEGRCSISVRSPPRNGTRDETIKGLFSLARHVPARVGF